MSKTVVLVTGSSRGLGNTLANRLSRKDRYQVFAGVRNLANFKNNLNSSNLKIVELDLAHQGTLENCVKEIIDAEGKIDVLIHNAGIVYGGPVDGCRMSEVREMFEVNFFGVLALTQMVLPYMRKQKKGKIIFISSIRGVESLVYQGLYSASKAALEAVAFDWAVSLRKWNIDVSVIQPGPITTGIEIKLGSYFQSSNNPYPMYPKMPLHWQSTEEVCKVVETVIEDPCPHFAYQTNDFSRETIEKYLKDPSRDSWINEQRDWFARLLAGSQEDLTN